MLTAPATAKSAVMSRDSAAASSSASCLSLLAYAVAKRLLDEDINPQPVLQACLMQQCKLALGSDGSRFHNAASGCHDLRRDCCAN